MKVLSLQPPWGLLICANLKDCENRRWRSSFSSEVLIHQSKRWDAGALKAIRRTDPLTWQYVLDHMAQAHWYGIIGKATFGEIVTHLDSKWFFGPFAYPSSKGVLFDHVIPCRGQLGFFDASPDVEAEVRRLASAQNH